MSSWTTYKIHQFGQNASYKRSTYLLCIYVNDVNSVLITYTYDTWDLMRMNETVKKEGFSMYQRFYSQVSSMHTNESTTKSVSQGRAFKDVRQHENTFVFSCNS